MFQCFSVHYTVVGCSCRNVFLTIYSTKTVNCSLMRSLPCWVWPHSRILNQKSTETILLFSLFYFSCGDINKVPISMCLPAALQQNRKRYVHARAGSYHFEFFRKTILVNMAWIFFAGPWSSGYYITARDSVWGRETGCLECKFPYGNKFLVSVQKHCESCKSAMPGLFGTEIILYWLF